jgi:hypothetical protein
MAYISQVLGLGGRFGSKGCNCPHCELHTDDMGNIDKMDTTQVRTLSRMLHQAHLPDTSQEYPSFPFTCPSCKKMFRNQEVCVTLML